MEPVDALAAQLEEHAIAETGESHAAAVQRLKKLGVFFLVTSGSSGKAKNKTLFHKLPKIELTTSNNSFTFKIYGGVHLRFRATVKFVNKKVWGRGTTAKNKQVMSLAYARASTFSSAVSAKPLSSSYKRISMSVEFAQILAKMYRRLIPVITYATRYNGAATKAFLKKFPKAKAKLAWHLMAKALSKCGHNMRSFVPMP